MPSLAVALAFLAQAAAPGNGASPQVYGPAAPAMPKLAAAPASEPAKPAECAVDAKGGDSREIVVCAPKPKGYRIDPDILAARREKREMMAGRPHNPHESFKDNKCKVVGPAPCMDAPMINLLAAAATAAEMADRLSKGQEIGSMFVTDPQPSEYQLYLEAKKRREDKEAAAAAKTAKAKAAAAGQAAPPTSASEPPKSAAQ
jgi:hypothetical protein